MRTLILACAALTLTLGQVSAGALCNKDGAVVTMSDGTVLYLGVGCDAAMKGGGTGFWFNAASFLAVHIDGKAYRVTDEVDCLPFCRSPL